MLFSPKKTQGKPVHTESKFENIKNAIATGLKLANTIATFRHEPLIKNRKKI